MKDETSRDICTWTNIKGKFFHCAYVGEKKNDAYAPPQEDVRHPTMLRSISRLFVPEKLKINRFFLSFKTTCIHFLSFQKKSKCMTMYMAYRRLIKSFVKNKPLMEKKISKKEEEGD